MRRPAAACLRFEASASRFFPQRAVLVEQLARAQARARRPADPSRSICTTTRFGKPPWTSRMSSLSRRTITSFEHLLALDRHAAGEALGVEDLEQGGEAVRVPVVRCGGEEQTVLEPPAEVANRAGDLRVDRVPPPLDGAAWWASSRIRREPGQNRPSQSRIGSA